jgi:hypothetical protein
VLQYFCPACFGEVPFEEPVCPRCGVVADEWVAGHTYPERLVHALGHPLPTTRMMAIIALEGRVEPDTSVPLALCALAFPLDVVQAMEILRALRAMPPSPQKRAGLRMLAEHPSRPVANRAARLLADEEGAPAEAGGGEPGGPRQRR